MTELFLGRQPIVDNDLRIVAYELLYRTPQTHREEDLDGDLATAQVLMNSTEIGLEDIVGGHLAFVNATRNHLINGHFLGLPPQQVVLEILEDVPVDDHLLKAVTKLSRQGYSIALDDFIYDKALDPLIAIANIIKLDVHQTPIEAVPQVQRLIRLRNPAAKLLAEKVETYADYEYLKTLNFDFFQGYFFARPTLIRNKTLAPSTTAVLELMNRVHDPMADLQELANLISSDISLSHKTLRYVNSPLNGVIRKVTSIQQAVMLLGLNTIRNWVTILAMTNLGHPSDALVNATLIRAKCCELLAEAAELQDKESYFTVGLFSTIDAMFEQPLDTILERLPLCDDSKLALMEHRGVRGEALKCALALERGLGEQIRFQNLAVSEIADLYPTALVWADGVTRQTRS